MFKIERVLVTNRIKSKNVNWTNYDLSTNYRKTNQLLPMYEIKSV